MATTTGTINIYTPFKKNLGEGDLVMGTDDHGVLLTTNSYTPSAAHEFVSEVTANEVSGNGYARDILTSGTWTINGTAYRFDAEDAVFTADGGDIVARYWVLYNNANGSDATRELVAYGLLDNGDADVTTTDTNSLTIQWNTYIIEVD